MKVTLVQSRLYLDQKSKNLSHLEKLLSRVKLGSQLIVLPEMFSTWFSLPDKKQAETADWWSTVKWMKKIAKSRWCTICGSIIIKEKDKHYNRFFRVWKKGEVSHYDKKHLFIWEEDKHFSPWKKKLIVKLWKYTVSPFICYDLRFPVWNRNEKHCDLTLYVADWHIKRIAHREKLLQARAIENQCFVIWVNAVGKLNTTRTNGGRSMVIDPLWNILYQASGTSEAVKTIDIDMDTLKSYRKSFPALSGQDGFKLL